MSQQARLMNLQGDTFYSRIPTLSDDEVFDYITNYPRYKREAVQLAIKELRIRGFTLSDDELSNIESFFNVKSDPIKRLPKFNPNLFRLIAYAVFGVGMVISVAIYFAAPAPVQNPLGYNPLDTKKYLRELELYGGQSNILASEFAEWFAGLWHGRDLSYTIASITVIISIIFWFIGYRRCSEQKNPPC